MNKIIFSIFLLFSVLWNSCVGFSQILKPIHWEFESDSSTYNSDSITTLFFKAYLDKGWYLYSTDMDSTRPMVTKFYFNKDPNFNLLGEIQPISRKKKYDSVWQAEVTYFNDSALFVQKIKTVKSPQNITGSISYQVCSDIDGMCVPFETEFVFFNNKNNNSIKTNLLATTSSPSVDSSLFSFLILSFLAGFLAILTPCVFPMIPITVSFFINNSKGSNLKNGITYGVSIIVIFTFLGLVLSLLLGPSIANDLLSNWIVNFFLFFLFILFGFSLLGFFEISLPSSFINLIDKQSDQKGSVGIFFMALTLVLVSFSCIGPLIGGILVQSANGVAIKPILGMLSFSIAFALPFTLLAIFPNKINKLPKSGNWMVTIKTVMGFLAIAYSFKFLNVIDKAYHFNIIDRDRFLFVWIIIFLVMSLYLTGIFSYYFRQQIKRTQIENIFGVFSFLIPFYLLTGFFGNTLKYFSAYLPPQKSTYIDVRSFERVSFYSNNSSNDYGNIKHSELFRFPHNLTGFFDYSEGLDFAKKINKPILLDFTGHGCVNCRDIESRVWSDKGIREILNQDYVLISLYVDDKTLLDKTDWYVSKYDNKIKKTIGKQNADFQITRFNNNAQPFYVILNPYTEEIINQPFGYDLNIENNKSYLLDGITKYYEK